LGYADVRWIAAAIKALELCRRMENPKSGHSESKEPTVRAYEH